MKMNTIKLTKSALKKITVTRIQFQQNMSSISRISCLKDIFLESVRSVQPDILIKNNVKVHQSHLQVGNDTFTITKPCYVVGFGKAVLGMAIELEKILGPLLKRAVVNVPIGIFENSAKIRDRSKIKFIEGALNNLPDEGAQSGAKVIKELVEKLRKDDLLIVLISGGGSALLPLPIYPVTLQEKLWLTQKLSKSGASITELNCVRKQLSVLKGGGLAELAYPCKTIALILSDVIGDPLDFIASGPTVPNKDSTEDVLNVLRKYAAYEETPPSIKSLLQEENQFRKSVTPVLNGNYPHVSNYIIGNNRIATEAAKNRATVKYGLQSVVLSTGIDGDVAEISRSYARLACQVASVIAGFSTKQDLAQYLNAAGFNFISGAVEELLLMDFRKGICLILAGEPTVVVRGKGKGGRNQQLALAFSLELNKLGIKGADISFLSGGTDGIDGPTDAAGAIGTSELLRDCSRQNINLLEYLDNNDSYGFYEKINDGQHLVKIGHTGTNVMDVHILIVTPKCKCKI